MSENKYPFLKAVSRPITDIADHFNFFILAGGFSALCLLALSFLFSQTFLCTLAQYSQQEMCSQNIVSYFFYFILKIFFLSVFLKTWYDHIYLKKQINITYFKTGFLSFLKITLCFILYLLICCLPILSLYLLIDRVPNPNWLIELCYFTFVSLGFIVPFILIRFYADLACLIEGESFMPFKELYKATCYKTSKIVLSFLLVLAFCFLLFLTINGGLRSHIFEPVWFYNIFAEFLFEVAILLILTIVVGFIRMQKEIFK